MNQRNASFDNRLRPTRFDDFLGQQKVRDRLMLAVEAALGRGEQLDHVLLSGPPGLGKTTLAYILGEAMGVHVKATSGPVIEKPADLAGLLTSLEPGDIVFIDEIHRMQRTVEEYLYSAMEDFVIDIMIDQGPNARSVRLELPHFTLVGATTRSGLISAPLRSRFGLQNRLDYYSHEELAQIVARNAGKLGVEIDNRGAMEIASRSRGTPRIANNLLRRVRDYAQVRADRTCASWRPSSRSSAAAPWAWRPSPWPWARSPTPLRRSTSLTSSKRATSTARPRVAWPCQKPSNASGSRPWVNRTPSSNDHAGFLFHPQAPPAARDPLRARARASLAQCRRAP